MLSLDPNPAQSPAGKLGLLNKIALTAWGAILLVLAIRIALSPHRPSILTVYESGGHGWLASESLYQRYRGFVYSPLAAAFFVPFQLLPDLVSNILWRFLNVAVFLGGVGWWLSAGFYKGIPRRSFGWVFLLLIPLTIGNLNIGQVNPLIIGLLMIGIAAAHGERWALAGVCIALATYFKIYPLAVGLLMILVFPKKFSGWLVLALILLGALPFVLQRPAYVLEQYHAWFVSRTSDDRRLYSANIAPCDLWMLLRLVHLQLSEHAYLAVQLLSGAAIGALCLWGRLKRWPRDRLLIVLFSLVSCWMLLCGPATESATYVMLAPAVVLALVHAYGKPMPLTMRALVTASFIILVAALGIGSLTHRKKDLYSMSLQPFGALIFTCYSIAWIAPRFWQNERRGEETALAFPPTAWDVQIEQEALIGPA